MLSKVKFIGQPQPFLDLDKPPLVLGRQEPLVALANNDPPAVFIIMNHGQNHTGAAASRIMHFLRNMPAQIDAGNALLRHSPQRYFDFAFRLSSVTIAIIARRAWGRVISSGCLAIHLSSAASSEGCKRTPTSVP